MINRREFGKLSTVAAGIGILSPITFLTGCPFTTALGKLEGQLPVLESIVNTVLGVVAPEYLLLEQTLVATLNNAVSAIKTTISNYKNNLQGIKATDYQKIEAALKAIQQTEGQLESAGHITDAASIKLVNAIIGAINTVVLEIGTLLPPAAVSSNTPILAKVKTRVLASPVQIITAQQLKDQFNKAQQKVKL